jgi:predicted metal-dependent enzyme (double-stranded beta helix superfamily)
MIIPVQPTDLIEQRILSPQQLAAEVRRLTATPAEWVHGDDGCEVWLISWLPGQSTGFHDHGGSAGAFGVVWGSLDECVVPRGGAPARVQVNQVTSGNVRSFGQHYVHDVRNSATGTVAVSVHAYSPPLSEMTRYDLTPGGLAVAATERTDDW